MIQKKGSFKQKGKKKAKRVPKPLPRQFQPLFLKFFASFALQIEQKRYNSWDSQGLMVPHFEVRHSMMNIIRSIEFSSKPNTLLP